MVPLLIGAAVATAGWGAKKGVDAKKNFSVASNYQDEAKKIFEEASISLNVSRNDTNSLLENLGTTKLAIYNKSITRFIALFEQIKNIEISELNISGLSIETTNEVLEMKKISVSMLEIAGGGVSALGAGALAGLGAYGGAMTFAAASTGTAISSLSGVAATNATLAWFGGGSLATGGMGMAGGTFVLGGLVAGPVLMVAGMVAALKAEKARADAYSNLQESKTAAISMNAAKKTSDIIGHITNEVNEVLIELDSYFKSILNLFKRVVEKSVDYRQYDDSSRNIVINAVAFATTLKKIMDFDIIDESGNPDFYIVNKSKEFEKIAIELHEKVCSI